MLFSYIFLGFFVVLTRGFAMGEGDEGEGRGMKLLAWWNFNRYSDISFTPPRAPFALRSGYISVSQLSNVEFLALFCSHAVI